MFNNTRSFDGESNIIRAAKIAEIECTAQIDVDRSALLDALNNLHLESIERSGYLFNETYLKCAEALKNYSLTSEQITQLIQEING